jgi:hypothetical protein
MRQQFAPAAPGDVGKSDALRSVFGSVFASVRLFALKAGANYIPHQGAPPSLEMPQLAAGSPLCGET